MYAFPMGKQIGKEKKPPLPKDISKTIYPLNTGTYTSTWRKSEPSLFTTVNWRGKKTRW